MDRRSFLSGVTAGAAATAASGCLAFGAPSARDDEEYHLEVLVQNDHDRSYRADVSVTDATGGTVFEQSVTLAAGEGRGFGDDHPAGEYTVTVDVADRGALQGRWETDQCDAYRVVVRINADGHLSNEVFCTDRTPTPGS